MKYIIKQELDTQTITIVINGMINTQNAEKMVFATALELSKTDFEKCFVDLTDSELDPNQYMTGMFIFAEVYKKAGIKKSVKTAALTKLNASGGEHRSCLEEAANHMGYELKHFTDREEASNWLSMKLKL